MVEWSSDPAVECEEKEQREPVAVEDADNSEVSVNDCRCRRAIAGCGFGGARRLRACHDSLQVRDGPICRPRDAEESPV